MINQTLYSPPYSITSEIVQLISKISESIGRLSIEDSTGFVPQLRRSNRLRTIYASLAIENNTLSLEQVTAIINGKSVLGKPREIKEVQNAFSVYEKLEQLDPFKEKDLLNAHKILMKELVDKSGLYRKSGVGIIKGNELIHVAPPAENIPYLMKDLFKWINNTNEHPLITSSVFHYEFEFIHPFSDGNGRMGRLWQTLILSRWKPLMAYLPVETVIHNNQDEYYKVLAKSDKDADSTPFIEFMLNALLLSFQDITDPVNDPVNDPVKNLLTILKTEVLSSSEIRNRLHLKHRQSFRKNYMHPALKQKLIEQTIPNKPNSRLQKYRITKKGRNVIAMLEENKDSQ